MNKNTRKKTLEDGRARHRWTDNVSSNAAGNWTVNAGQKCGL